MPRLVTTATGVSITGGLTATDACTITTADNNAQLILVSTDADASSGPEMQLYRNSASPADNDAVGQIQFRGNNDAAQEISYAEIDVLMRDVSDGAEDGEIRLLVTRNGTSREALSLSGGDVVFNEGSEDIDFRVESNGSTHAFFVDAGGEDVCIGKSSASLSTAGAAFTNITSTNTYLGLTNTSTSSSHAVLYANRQGGSGQAIQFRAANVSEGNISVNSSGVTYNTTSDRRLKSDIQPIVDATDKLMQMQPVSHKWIADPDGDAVHGFIAQDMQQICPEAISGEDGGEEMMSMDYGRITPILVAALQEANRKIDQLEQRIAEMENN